MKTRKLISLISELHITGESFDIIDREIDATYHEYFGALTEKASGFDPDDTMAPCVIVYDMELSTAREFEPDARGFNSFGPVFIYFIEE